MLCTAVRVGCGESLTPQPVQPRHNAREGRERKMKTKRIYTTIEEFVAGEDELRGRRFLPYLELANMPYDEILIQGTPSLCNPSGTLHLFRVGHGGGELIANLLRLDSEIRESNAKLNIAKKQYDRAVSNAVQHVKQATCTHSWKMIDHENCTCRLCGLEGYVPDYDEWDGGVVF